MTDPADKCFRCTGCGRWIRPSTLCMCQAWWLCYHWGAEVPKDRLPLEVIAEASNSRGNSQKTPEGENS